MLAGGVFANVKLNQRIHELEGVERLFVFPHMGDGGLGYGASSTCCAEPGAASRRRSEHVYLGPSYGESEILAALRAAGVEVERPCPTSSGRRGRALARGKMVGALRRTRWSSGRGRSATARSSTTPTDPAVNDWLNKHLKRTEFMPFAPVTLAERATAATTGLAGAEHAAEFMTITFDCTQAMREQSPAVVHVDGTARPQLVRERRNPGYYDILDEYRRSSGLPCAHQHELQHARGADRLQPGGRGPGLPRAPSSMCSRSDPSCASGGAEREDHKAPSTPKRFLLLRS